MVPCTTKAIQGCSFGTTLSGHLLDTGHGVFYYQQQKPIDEWVFTRSL
jgi:hypothetical protein